MTTYRHFQNDFIQNLNPLVGEGEARAICRYIFDDYFGVKNFDEAVHEFSIADLTTIKERLLAGEPPQYIVGFAWFYSLKFKVNPTVLIPRPETEELVEWVLSDNKGKNSRVLDIGTGSGCIPITLKVKNPALSVSAIDISESALITASRNAFRHGAEIDFSRLDILNEGEWSKTGSFDVIVSNPPYIPNREKNLMTPSVFSHEPSLALFVDDAEPLIFYEKITDFSIEKFSENEPKKGALYFECNEFNANDVYNLLITKGFEQVELRKDMSGKNRMVRGYYVNPPRV